MIAILVFFLVGDFLSLTFPTFLEDRVVAADDDDADKKEIGPCDGRILVENAMGGLCFQLLGPM
jgi:hypothetical protein